MAALVNHLIEGNPDEPGDCAIVALRTYLGVPYTDLLRAVTVLDRKQGRAGVWRRTMIRVAAQFGVVLRRRKADPEDGYGILVTHDHAVVLREGWILDRCEVWPVDVWCRSRGVKLDECDFLTEAAA